MMRPSHLIASSQTRLHRAQDIKFALGVLGIDTCFVVGVSGGGPYALAFVSFEPYTVRGVLLISAAGNPGRACVAVVVQQAPSGLCTISCQVA